MRAAVVAVALAAGGCNAILGISDVHSTSNADAQPDAMVDAPPAPACPTATSGQVVGCAFDDYISAAGSTVTVARDLSKLTIEAYVVDGSGNLGAAIPAQMGATGVFTLAVPDGATYYLRLFDHVTPGAVPLYIVTDRRDLDFGFTLVGHPNTTPVTTQTTVELKMGGMTAWQAPDYLLVDSFAVNTENFVGYPVAPSNPPATGATSTDTTINWQNGYNPGVGNTPMLIDGSIHDDFWLTHNTSLTVNDQSNHPYVAGRVADTFTSVDVTIQDGKPVAVTGNFTQVPTSQSQTFTVNLGDLRAAISDGGRYTWEELTCGVLTNPGAAYGDGIGPAIVGFDGDPSSNFTPRAQTSVTFPPITYGNPYPSTWPAVIPCSLTQFRFVKAPGATKPKGTRSNRIGVWDTVATPYLFKSGGHAPTGITVGGKPFLDGGTVPFDGTTPVTVQWTAVPNTDYYAVAIEEIGLDVTTTTRTSVGSLATTATSVAIPASLLKKDHLYVLYVAEQRQTAAFATGHFNRTSTPSSGGTVASGLFRFSSDCGNSVKDGTEQCDTGGDSATCDSDCTAVACGDGYVNTVAGEQCDNIFESAGCDADCTLPVCGDGYWNQRAGEQCDDGNTTSGDGCSSTCTLEHCGNGTLDAYEDCDDQNTVNGDGCNAFCRVEDGWTCDATKTPSVCTRL